MVHYEKHCSEPWISHIDSGVKTVEGRLKKSVFAKLQAGDTVTWFDGDKRVTTLITGFREYPDFNSYLQAEGVGKVLPGVDTIEEGLTIYHSFTTEEERANYSVLAILVQKLTP